MRRNPTINDVAREAGLSIKTVSRALNDEPHVRPVTRARVMAAVKALDYKPNISARSLAGARSFFICLLYDNPSPAYVMGLQGGVLSRCEAKGYNLLIHACDNLDRNIGREVLEYAARSRVDGFILTPPLSENRGLINKLVKHQVRHIRISQLKLPGSGPLVSSNEKKISFDLTNYLISLGHTRIAFIKGHPQHGGSRHRLEGYRQALRQASITVPANYVQQGYFTFESGVASAKRLLNLKTRPTAVFASNDYMASGVITVAHQMHLGVPEDVSVAGFDDAPVARQIWPALTTVRQPVQDLAAQAADLLIGRLGNQTLDDQAGTFECDLILRQSTGACP